MFLRGRDLKLSLFADGDYADIYNDRRLVSGVAAMLGNVTVSASSMTQHCVTLSMSEAAFFAMAHGTKTALAIKAVLDFAQLHLSGRLLICTDHEGAKTLAGKPQDSHRSKHIHVGLHFLRGLVRLGQVTIHSVASAEQYVDILTKPLRCEAFRGHRDFYGSFVRVFVCWM